MNRGCELVEMLSRQATRPATYHQDVVGRLQAEVLLPDTIIFLPSGLGPALRMCFNDNDARPQARTSL